MKKMTMWVSFFSYRFVRETLLAVQHEDVSQKMLCATTTFLCPSHQYCFFNFLEAFVALRKKFPSIKNIYFPLQMIFFLRFLSDLSKIDQLAKQISKAVGVGGVTRKKKNVFVMNFSCCAFRTLKITSSFLHPPLPKHLAYNIFTENCLTCRCVMNQEVTLLPLLF